MGWSWASGEYQGCGCQKIHLEKHCHKFGVPRTLISDNGLQFDSKAFRRYCYDLCITNRYSTPAYPHGNGQAEVVNKVIVSGLKKSLDDAKGKWVEELSHVLWAYHTTPRRSIGETPFSMTYGAEAVIPLEIGFPTLRSNSFISSKNDELLEKSLDLIEERRESAMVQLACYQNKLKQGWCQREVKATNSWRLGLKKSPRNGKEPSMGKVRTQLGRAISYYIGGRDRCLLSRGSGGKNCTIPLECKQP